MQRHLFEHVLEHGFRRRVRALVKGTLGFSLARGFAHKLLNFFFQSGVALFRPMALLNEL